MATTDSHTAYGKTKRYASSGALLIVGALALGNWLLSPHLGYLHAVERLEPVVMHMAEERDRICGTREAKLEELRRLQDELAEADSRFFSDGSTKEFVRCLLPLIEATGCTVVVADFTGGTDTITVPDPNESLIVVVNSANVTVLGQHDEIVALLKRLQTHRPKVWIDACRIGLFDKRSAQLECSLVLTVQVIRGQEEPGDS